MTGRGMEWVEEWAWVAGYSTLSTLVVIFNFLIFFSVGKNKFLHYGTHWVMLALSLRNLCRVGLSLWLVFLAKLLQTPWILQETFNIPSSNKTNELERAESMPIMCTVLSTLDTIMMSLLMFYLAALSLYMFCRQPNPHSSSTSEATMKLYGLNSGIPPVREQGWIAPLLLLLPPTLSVLLALPVPLMQKTHPMTAVPRGTVCASLPGDQFDTYQSSVTILGFYLPAAIVVCLLIGLSIRRCVSCSSGVCVSSFCKEEMVLGFLTAPYILSYLALHLPILDHYLEKLDLQTTGIQEYVKPEMARAAEMVFGILLPIILYSTLAPYRKFSSDPDVCDVKRSKKDLYRNHSANAPDSPGLSQASLDI